MVHITFIDNCKYVLNSTLCVLSICMCIMYVHCHLYKSVCTVYM